MPLKYSIHHHLMSDEDVRDLVALYGDQTDEFGLLIFDPSNPEHLTLDETVTMKCSRCLKIEEVPFWVLMDGSDSFIDPDHSIPALVCPFCGRGTQLPADCFDEALLFLKTHRNR